MCVCVCFCSRPLNTSNIRNVDSRTAVTFFFLGLFYHHFLFFPHQFLLLETNSDTRLHLFTVEFQRLKDLDIKLDNLFLSSTLICPVMKIKFPRRSKCSMSKSMCPAALSSAAVLTLCQPWHHNSVLCDGHLINGIINCWQNNLWCIMLPMGCTAYQIK